jgi:transposase InsO family protein
MITYIHNKTLRELLHRRAIRHIRTRPYTPRTNGKVERYQQTCNASGPTPCNTPQATPAAKRCRTGSTTTTSSAPTAPSATAHPSTAFGTSQGITASAVAHLSSDSSL